MNLPPKVLAYLRAEEVLKRAKAEPGLYDRATAKAINLELQAIAKRLLQSARRIHQDGAMKNYLADHPDHADAIKKARLWRRYLSGRKALDKLNEACTPATTDAPQED